MTGQHGAWAPEVSFIERYAKALLAAAFGLSPAAVVGVLALFGVHIDAGILAALLGVLGPLLGVAGVAVGPANKTPVPTLVVQTGTSLKDAIAEQLTPPTTPPAV